MSAKITSEKQNKTKQKRKTKKIKKKTKNNLTNVCLYLQILVSTLGMFSIFFFVICVEKIVSNNKLSTQLRGKKQQEVTLICIHTNKCHFYTF